MVASLRLTESQLERIFRHADRAAPEECCGVLLGARTAVGGKVEQVIESRNVTALDRCRYYALDPLDLFAVHRRARQEQLEVLGYYHSHPSSDAQPSATDVVDAWPGVSYLIIGRPAGQLEARSWRLTDDGSFAEEPLVVSPEVLYAKASPGARARTAHLVQSRDQEVRP